MLAFCSSCLSRREMLLRIAYCSLFEKSKSALDLGGLDGFDVAFDHTRKFGCFGWRQFAICNRRCNRSHRFGGVTGRVHSMKRETNRPVASWWHEPIDAQAQCAHVALLCFLDNFANDFFGFAFEKLLGNYRRAISTSFWATCVACFKTGLNGRLAFANSRSFPVVDRGLFHDDWCFQVVTRDSASPLRQHTAQDSAFSFLVPYAVQSLV
jgi:hypothetical protein